MQEIGKTRHLQEGRTILRVAFHGRRRLHIGIDKTTLCMWKGQQLGKSTQDQIHLHVLSMAHDTSPSPLDDQSVLAEDTFVKIDLPRATGTASTIHDGKRNKQVQKDVGDSSAGFDLSRREKRCA